MQAEEEDDRIALEKKDHLILYAIPLLLFLFFLISYIIFAVIAVHDTFSSAPVNLTFDTFNAGTPDSWSSWLQENLAFTPSLSSNPCAYTGVVPFLIELTSISVADGFNSKLSYTLTIDKRNSNLLMNQVHAQNGVNYVDKQGFLNSNINVFSGSGDSFLFPINSLYYSKSFTSTISLTGSTVFYPFESYTTSFQVFNEDFYLLVRSLSNNSSLPASSIANSFWDPYVTFRPSIAGFNVEIEYDVTEQNDDQYGFKNFNIKIDRNFSSKIYPCLALFFMTIVGLATGVATTYVITHPSFALSGTFLSAFVALMFSLPSFRNSMPSVPPVGVALDFYIFYWVQSLVVIAFFSNLINQVISLIKDITKKFKIKKKRKQAREAGKTIIFPSSIESGSNDSLFEIAIDKSTSSKSLLKQRSQNKNNSFRNNK